MTNEKQNDRVDNNTYATTDQLFKMCCEEAHIPATGRQASKFRNGKGLAIKFRAVAKTKMENQQKDN